MTPLEKAILDLKAALADVRKCSGHNASISSFDNSTIEVHLFKDEEFRQLPGSVVAKQYGVDNFQASKIIDGVKFFRLVEANVLPVFPIKEVEKELVARFQLEEVIDPCQTDCLTRSEPSPSCC